MADIRTLPHVSFRLTGGGDAITLTLPINPDQIQTDAPVRHTTTQTMGGIYKDIMGIGVRTLTIQGSTGWRKSLLSNYNGLESAQKLWWIYTEFYKRFLTTPNVELLFVNDIDQYCYQVTIDDFQTFRNKSEPLITRYSLPLTILADMALPTDQASDVAASLAASIAVNIANCAKIGSSVAIKPTPYLVQAGDTLNSISLKFYGSSAESSIIATFNQLPITYALFVNQTIMLPAI